MNSLVIEKKTRWRILSAGLAIGILSVVGGATFGRSLFPAALAVFLTMQKPNLSRGDVLRFAAACVVGVMVANIAVNFDAFVAGVREGYASGPK
jgi:hypothetical protein